MRRICVVLTDGGNPVAGQNVKATDCFELQSAPNGETYFLVDADPFSIFVNGAESFKSTLADSPDRIELKKNGDSWSA